MNTLEDLNNYGKTQFTYTDLRLPGIQFDTQYPPSLFMTIGEGSSFYAPVGANITDLSQPAVVQATYIISFDTSGYSLTFPSIPGVIISNPTANAWKVEGINSVDVWNQIKSPLITPPVGTTEPFTFHTVLDSELSTPISTNVNILISAASYMQTNTSFTSTLYRTSRLQANTVSNFELSSSLSKMYSLSSNMNTGFSVFADLSDRYLLNASFSLLADANLLRYGSAILDSTMTLSAIGGKTIGISSNQNSLFSTSVFNNTGVWTSSIVNSSNFYSGISTAKTKWRLPQMTSDGTRLIIERYSVDSTDSELTPSSLRNSVIVFSRSGTTWSPEVSKTYGFGSCIDSSGVWLGTFTDADDSISRYKIYNRSGTTWTLHSNISGITSNNKYPCYMSTDATYLVSWDGIYKRSGTTWTFLADYNNLTQLTNDGQRVVEQYVSGGVTTVNIRRRSTDTNWVIEKTFTNVYVPSPDSYHHEETYFLSRDGNTFIYRDATSTKAYIYTRSGTTWTLVNTINDSNQLSDYVYAAGNQVITNPYGDQVLNVYQGSRPKIRTTSGVLTDSFYPPVTVATSDYEFTNTHMSDDQKTVIVMANYRGALVGNQPTYYSRIISYTRP